MNYDDVIKHYEQMPVEEKRKFWHEMVSAVLETMPGAWNGIVERHFAGKREPTEMEKALFHVAYNLALQNFCLYWRDNCLIIPKQKTAAPDESTLPSTEKVN
jgi:hypothetical protein